MTSRVRPLLLALLGTLALTTAGATHIVGGEFRLTRNGPNAYTLTLNLYFDNINGRPEAEDRSLTATLFRKRDNAKMLDLILPQVSSEFVKYTNPSCANTNLSTRLLRYQAPLPLSTSAYDDPQGYYVVWERCCRNRVINNIESPGSAGNAFYLEFPALVQNGRPFANSSPAFVTPAGDYACAGQPFALDFSATDPDGDELRYALVVPFAGNSSEFEPLPRNQPAQTGANAYLPVLWRLGTNLTNVIPGTPPLRVNPRTGQLTVTPSQPGLFVFSVLCEEWRNGARIGTVRRDFQVLVLDCPRNQPPAARVLTVNRRATYREGDLLFVRPTDDRCLDLRLTDPDPNTRLTLSLLPVNFVNNNVVTLTNTGGIVRTAADTLRAQVCFDACAESNENRPLTFDLLVRDEGCPAPRTDTVRVSVVVESRPNTPPIARTDLFLDQAIVEEGGLLRFNALGNDVDGDNISLAATGRGFDLAAVGMRFAGGAATGSLTVPFTWQPPCAAANRASYTVDFVLTDTRCARPLRDTVSVLLFYRPRPNQPPNLRTTLPGNAATVRLDQDDTPVPLANPKTIAFDVIGQDADPNDRLTVSARGRGFELTAAGMRFETRSATGRVTAPFSWTPDCSTLPEDQLEATFTVDFLLTDNTCAPNRTDTTTVRLTLRDRPSEDFVQPVNVFTPNGDQRNEYFELRNLPPDNCANQFRYVEIYNRWGTVVYRTDRRDFRWDGGNYPNTSYFYRVQYTRRQWRGTVTRLGRD